MSDNYSFNARNVEPSKARENLPKGWYRCMVVGTDMKPTKKGNGSYIEITWKVLDGTFENRQVWTRLNVKNENAQAVEIAEKDLSAICHATGVLEFRRHEELRNHTALVYVTVKDDKNETAGYKAAAGSTTAPSYAPAAAGDDDSSLPF